MQPRFALSRILAAVVLATVCAQHVLDRHVVAQPSTGVTREEILVPHVSTVPANAGERVGIAVRHVRPANQPPTNGPVLFTNAASISTLAVIDLNYKTYSVAAALAEDGFDVYLMDHTGYGRSPRPTMDDPCNADPSDQRLLIPQLLAAPCTARYPRHLVTIFTELSEIDSVVDYIREQTHSNHVSLAGWSRAAFRFGLYAAQHPEKVGRLALVGPGYRPDAPSEFPSANTPTGEQVPRGGVPAWPFTVRRFEEPLLPWEGMRRCEDIVDTGVHEALMASLRTYADPSAASWGTPAGMLYRVPTGSQVDAGWNRAPAKQVSVPVLLVVGEHDPRFTRELPALYADLGSQEKVMVQVQCGTHFLLFERNHQAVHRAFTEFLTKGTVNGRQGLVMVDREGKYLP